jgi:NADPH-dependent curcumin reductase CurA
MRAGGVGRIVASKAQGFAINDFVYGMVGWQAYYQGKPDHPAVVLEHRQVGGSAGRDIDHLGLFGTSGMTAYFGMFDVGRLKDGDRVVVSGAAGSVGLVCVISVSYRRHNGDGPTV